jgi:glycosyltransferase involved in cell wall biosynthesis
LINVKVSQICTLKNEEKSIKKFIDSLLSQSRQPDEIIIVDGGSTDNTIEIIKAYIKNGKPIQLIIENEANIARGRNIAIKNARYNIIASTDAGCKLDKDWLLNLIKPFEKDSDIDVVSGWYEADAKTDFEKIVAALTYPKLKDVLKNVDNFLPSSRSVAYKKECWEKVKGYPEWLYTAEDSLFDLNLKKAGFKFAFEPDAVVKWEVRPNLKKTFKQYYLYAKGDGQANLFSQAYLCNLRTTVIGILMFLLGFIFFLVWILLGILAFKHYLKPTVEVYKTTRILKSVSLVPVVSTVIDLAKITGYLVGTAQRTLNPSYFKK